MRYFVHFSICFPLLIGVDAHQRPTASVSNGVLKGTTTALYAAEATVNKFLGIPYALSPPLRYAEPSPARNWTGERDATKFGSTCIQQDGALSALTSTKDVAESEDCLYLNVYQPGGLAPESGWPVMLWIHGGGLQFGSGSLPFYDGSRFAAFENVILVTFNYRLSLFGFPGAPDLPNLGFLDQRYALSWVSKNIKAFRGNPRKVTIFGESSGSISVDALLTMPPKEPEYHAAILQSGTVLSNSLASLGTNPTNTWNMTLKNFNCSEAIDAVSCLRQVPVASLKDFATKNVSSTAVVSDNRTYTPHSALQRSSGVAAKVPLLIGTTANDGSVFTIGQANLSEFISTTFAPLPDLQKELTEAYKVGGPGLATESAAVAQIFTEVGLQCPTELLARQVQNTSEPVWRYIYNATFPNLTPAEGLGVYHSSELPIEFSTYNVTTATSQQYAFSNYMRGAWARFAKNPKMGPGWGAVGTFSGTDLGILGLDGSSGVTVVKPGLTGIDDRCKLYAPLYSLLA